MPDDRRGTAPVAGTHIYYEIAGAGTAVVLIHGFTLDSRMWDGQVAALAGRHRVVRYDMRGFGRSDPPGEESYSAAQDLSELLEYLGVDAAAIVGLSLGGAVAIDFALTYPNAIRALVLVDSTVGGWQWSPEWNERVGPVWSAGKDLGAEAAKELWLGLPMFSPALEQAESGLRLRHMVSDYSGWHWLHEDPQRHLDPPALQRLPEIAAPTLVLVGERDEPDFHATANALTAGVSNAEQVVIPRVGHVANMEVAEQFNVVLNQFLEQH